MKSNLYQPQAKMSSSNTTQQSSQIPTHFRTISRNNSNTSTASSSNKGDLSSTISTANSVTSSRSQLSKNQLVDHRQLFATCGSSTPIRSFQRATISSVVKTRAFDKDPVLQGLLATPSPSGQNSVSNSQTPSPHSTPLFSRSRSLRMSGGPQRYRQSPSHYRTSSRTPELYSFNSGDISSSESQSKLLELNNERIELKESLEFLECERQVLMDSTKELKEHLQSERSQWRREHDDLKKQITELMAARIKAESQLTRIDMEMNDIRIKNTKLKEELTSKNQQLSDLQKETESLKTQNQELSAINNELKLMLAEKLKYNGLTSVVQQNQSTSSQLSECVSIVTEMAHLRIELNEKDRILSKYRETLSPEQSKSLTNCQDIDSLNKFLDQTVECIKSWPDEIAGSSHVQNLMKTLLSSYRGCQNDLGLKMENLYL